MAKKDKKKQKKQAGDWSDDEPAAKPAAAATPVENDDDDGDDVPSMAASASRFSFADMDNGNGNDDNDDDDEDGGGLMATIAASSAKSKKDKKKAKKGKAEPLPEEDEEELENDDAGAAAADLESKAPIEMTADQLMEEEFGPEKPKKGGKKGGKKQKKGQQQQPDYDEDEFLNEQVKGLSVDNKKAETKEERPATPAADQKDDKAATPTAAGGEDDDAAEEENDGAPKLLSKKEKERLKKEKEKAKKKAQAAAKKGATGGATTDAAAVDPAVAAPSASTATEEAKELNEEEAETGGAGSKNKKKKKKGGAAGKEEAVAAPTAPAAGAAGKKVPAHIAALRAAMEKQKAAEEEARRKEEEERRRIEEEENRLAEIERQKEEEKKRKKEKEKLKIEQAKKEGRYMTPKQKQEAAAAAARRDAMIASGQITVEGLAGGNNDDDSSKPKKVSYGKKKPQQKKGQATASASAAATPDTSSTKTASPHDEIPTIAKDPTRTEEHEPNVDGAAGPEEKDDWDASSAEDEAKPTPAKAEESDMDDWDASSASEKEEEEKQEEKTKNKPASAPTAAKLAAKVPAAEVKKPQTNGATKPAAQQEKAIPAKAAPAGKAAPPGKAAPSAPAKGKAAPSKPAEEEESSEESSEEEDSDDDDDDSDDSDDDSSDEDSSDEEERISAAKRMTAQRKADAAARRDQQRKDAIAAGSKDDLRSPICCILGHVDTGKTKLLDKIRQTNVQEGEAGGITQQIGATYFPMDIIQQKTQVLGEHDLKEYKLPGLLVIDTPGHESFTNLRTRGSSLCNIAILVVDIMHGLEPQTLESIRLLRAGKTPFIVALNKIDRLYGWNSTPNGDFRGSLAKQGKAVQNEFAKRLGETQLAFAEQGLNAIPYYDNTNFAKNVSLVPTSAHTGEGIPDMLMLIIKLTQERMSSQLMYISELECTVLEVKVIEGLGTTLDVILSNGVLHEGDKIIVCGLNGPIVTQIRAILTPQPLKELRIKGQYVHHQEVKAALGIKLVAPDLEKAIAGSKLLVCGPDDDEEYLKEEVMEVLQTLTSSVDKSGKGVYVQASTLGSLEALLEFLRTSKIPVSGINIGPVHKKDITRCAVMLDRAPEFAVLLAFDVTVDKDAEKMAEELNLKIFKADIIYHLFDAFTKHNAEVLEAKRKDSAPNAIWPCKLKILKCFAKRDPIIVGCDIVDGQTVRVGTPVCVVKVHPETKQKTIIKLGKISSLEINHTAKDIVKRSQVGAGVAVKIEHAVYESAKQFGRNFDENDLIVSLVSRSSIDTLKSLFRDDVAKDDWVLIKQLKSLLDIP